MRWSETQYPEFALRYVRRFAWYPRYDLDTKQTVWLEWMHQCQWRGTAWWRNADSVVPHDLDLYTVVSDSRNAK